MHNQMTHDYDWDIVANILIIDLSFCVVWVFCYPYAFLDVKDCMMIILNFAS